jgi:hypothetical protein
MGLVSVSCDSKIRLTIILHLLYSKGQSHEKCWEIITFNNRLQKVHTKVRQKFLKFQNRLFKSDGVTSREALDVKLVSLIWRILLKDVIKVGCVTPRYRTWAVVAVRCKIAFCPIETVKLK